MIETLRRLLARRARALPPRVERWILAAAALLVAALSVLAWRSSDLRFGDLRWAAIIVSLVVAAPASLILRALEFDAAARIVGQRPSMRRSLRIAVVASAANLLPLPGSLIVNVRSLSEDGATYGRAVTASAVPGVAWLGFVGIVGGSAIAISGAEAVGGVVGVGGVIALAVAIRLFVATAPPTGRAALAVRIGAVELGWLLISAVRLSLALAALRESATIVQAFALSVAGAVTVAIGFFPAGLGIREVLVAGLAPVVGLPFDTGVLVGVLDRIVWLTFLAVVAATIVAAGSRTGGRTP